MDAYSYQVAAARTLIAKPEAAVSDQQMMLIWTALGLAGECGEVVEHVKKGVLHRHGVDEGKLAEEIGDVLWYVAGICSVMRLDIGEIMQANIAKLESRYPDGFTSEASINRGG